MIDLHRLRALGVLAFLCQLAMPIVAEDRLSLALANSTCNAMQRIGAAYQTQHPIPIDYQCKSSGLLAKGLYGGALSADLFVSADQEWMDYAVEHGLVERESVSSFWGTRLVVAASKASTSPCPDWQGLAGPQVTAILIGDPSTAPFGRYSKEALERSGLWERVKPKIETRKNIALLEESLGGRSDATVGILFETNLNPTLRTCFVVDPRLHSPIRYYVAPLKQSRLQEEARAYLAFLRSEQATAILMEERFQSLPEIKP